MPPPLGASNFFKQDVLQIKIGQNINTLVYKFNDYHFISSKNIILNMPLFIIISIISVNFLSFLSIRDINRNFTKGKIIVTKMRCKHTKI